MLQETIQPSRGRPAIGAGGDGSASIATIRYRLVRDAESFAALGEAWQALFASSAKSHQVFQSHAWLETWCRHYLSDSEASGDLAVATAWEGERLVAALPLIATRCAGLTILRWMGAPVSQYGDGLAAERAMALLGPLIEFAASETRAGVLDLRKVRDDAAVRSALDALGARAITEDGAPCIDLSSVNDVDAYLARFSANGRKQRRRRRRRLEEVAPLAFDWHEPGILAAEEALATVRQKRATLPAGQFASALDDRFERFFADVAGTVHREFSCRISTMRSGGKPIAREIGLVAKGGYSAHVGTFDPEFAKFAPGIQQIDETVAACCAGGLHTVDLLAPANEYKLELSDRVMPVRDYVQAFSWRGSSYVDLVLRSARPVARRLRDAAVSLCKPA